MTEKSYYREFKNLGYAPTGDETILTEFWANEFGELLVITRASELSPEDRAAAVERIKRTLGIDFPVGPRVH